MIGVCCSCIMLYTTKQNGNVCGSDVRSPKIYGFLCKVFSFFFIFISASPLNSTVSP